MIKMKLKTWKPYNEGLDFYEPMVDEGVKPSLACIEMWIWLFNFYGISILVLARQFLACGYSGCHNFVCTGFGNNW